MAKRYAYAVWLFEAITVLFHGIVAATAEGLDQQLVWFLEMAWEEGEPMALAGDAISGLQHRINRKRCFPGAWRYFNAWSRFELPTRTPPLPALALLGVAGSFLESGCVAGATLVLLAFHCLLRTGEMLGAASNHVTWSRAGLRGVLALPLTKSGQRTGAPESVTFSDSLVGSMLHMLVQLVGEHAPLWAGSAEDFRRAWRFHLQRLGLDPEAYKPYALRRGGATAHFIEHNCLSTTQHRGRWASYRACRIYVVEGQRELAESSLSAATRAAILHYAQILRRHAAPVVRAFAGRRAAQAFFDAPLPP